MTAGSHSRRPHQKASGHTLSATHIQVPPRSHRLNGTFIGGVYSRNSTIQPVYYHSNACAFATILARRSCLHPWYRYCGNVEPSILQPHYMHFTVLKPFPLRPPSYSPFPSFSNASRLSIFLFPNTLSVFCRSISLISPQLLIRDSVPSLLTTNGPMWSSLTVDPPLDMSILVVGVPLEGLGRGRG